MIKHHQYKILKLSPQLFFNVVSGVEQYPQFIPWCSESKIIRRYPTHFDCLMSANFRVYESSYISSVYIKKNEKDHIYQIKSISNETPAFKQLISIWDIYPYQQDSCKYDYNISFSFRNIIYQSLSQIILKEIVQTMSNAFEQRAYQLQKQWHQQNKVEPINKQQNQIEQVLIRLSSKNLISERQLATIQDELKKPRIEQILQQGYSLYYEQPEDKVNDRNYANFLINYLLENNLH